MSCPIWEFVLVRLAFHDVRRPAFVNAQQSQQRHTHIHFIAPARTYNMRPPTRATRSSRAADLEETEAQQPVGRGAKTQSRPTSSRSSRTGTPYSDKDKKPRHRMTDKQLERLEMLYELDTHPTREQKQALGDEVGMYVL